MNVRFVKLKYIAVFLLGLSMGDLALGFSVRQSPSLTGLESEQISRDNERPAPSQPNDTKSETAAHLNNFNNGSIAERMGRLSHNRYSNRYFGFTIRKPYAWTALNDEQRLKSLKAGEKIIAGNNSALQQQYRKANADTLNLFAFYRYPLGTPRLNPSVLSVAENVSKYRTTISEYGYLSNVKRLLSNTKLNARFGSLITTRQLGGVEFRALKVYTYINGVNVEQDYYVKITKGYALSFIATYTDVVSRLATNRILSSIRF